MRSVKTISISTNNSSVSVINGTLYVNGKKFKDGDVENKQVISITIDGDVGEIDSSASVTVNGNVTGDIDAGGSVAVDGNVDGDIDCGGSCSIRGSHIGDIDAGGSVSIK